MASTLLVNTIDTQSGSTISIPTGKVLAITDAGGLTVAGTTIESGDISVNSITATSTDLGTGSEVAMWTSKNKAVFMVDATGGARTVQLPAPGATGRSTVSIVIAVKAMNTAITPNLVTINNSSGTEVFTLYAKGDHVEFVSDGTSDFRTGNEYISAYGLVYMTGNNSIGTSASESMFQTGAFTVKYDRGNWFDEATDFRVDVPYNCRIYCEALTHCQGTGTQHISATIKRYYNSNASNEWLYRTDNWSPNMTSGGYGSAIYDFTAGDEIEYGMFNQHSSGANTAAGGSNGHYQGSWGRWTVLRRF